MNVKYEYNLSDFPNDKVSVDRLTEEIRTSLIITALDYINNNLNIVDIFFKSDLSTNDKTILDNIVSNHSGEPLPNAPQVVKSEVLTEHLKYVESGDLTQGLFCAESVVIDVLSGESLIVKDVSWQFTTSIMSATIGVIGDMINDELEIEVSPNTLIGALISNMSTGDTKLYVSQTVIDNLKLGNYVGLYQTGTTYIELGRVVEIGENYVVTDTPSTVSANAGSYISMSFKIIPYMYINSPSRIEIGKDIPTGQRIPANTIIRVIYKNNNSTNKKVSILVEYLY